jgi:hypothetical protein
MRPTPIPTMKRPQRVDLAGTSSLVLAVAALINRTIPAIPPNAGRTAQLAQPLYRPLRHRLMEAFTLTDDAHPRTAVAHR